MRRIIALALFAVCAFATPAWASGHTVAGTITVTDSSSTVNAPSFAGRVCDGSIVSDGYSDIAAGAQVVVKNESNKTIATGQLGAGKATASLDCVLPFTVKNVPDAKFYTIEVSHRGGLTYSAKKLAKLKYKVELSLGS